MTRRVIVAGLLVAALGAARVAGAGAARRVFGAHFRTQVSARPLWLLDAREHAVPAAGGGRVFAGGTDGSFRAVDARSGAELWHVDVGAPVESRPVVHRDAVVFGAGDGTVRAVGAANGEPLWTWQGEAPFTAPPRVGPGPGGAPTVYVANRLNTLVALDAATGAWRWHYRRELPASAMALLRLSGAAVHGGRVYVGFSDGVLVALSSEDGGVQWTRRLGDPADRFRDVDGTPVVAADAGLVLVSVHARGVFALDKTTGEVRWSRDVRAPSDLRCSRDACYVATPEAMWRLGLRTGEVEWSHAVKADADGAHPVPLRPVLRGRWVVFPRSDGTLDVRARANGRLRQRIALHDGFHGGVAVSRDGLYLLSDNGYLYGLAYHAAPIAGRAYEFAAIPGI